MSAFNDRVFSNAAARRRKARAARFPACIAEQLESRGMLSGIGIAVMPPVAPPTPTRPPSSPRRRRPGRAAARPRSPRWSLSGSASKEAHRSETF